MSILHRVHSVNKLHSLDVSISAELRSLAREFRTAAHELLDLLDVQSPTVSKLKVIRLIIYVAILCTCEVTEVGLICVCTYVQLQY